MATVGWRDLTQRLEATAQALGLAPGEVEYIPCHQGELLALEAYGLPGRFRHWIFGMRLERLRRQKQQGQLFISELTVGSQPARIYFCLGLDLPWALALALAHGLAHADFINNHERLGRPERRRVPALAPVLAAEARRWRMHLGEQPVEDLLSACLALEHHSHLLGQILEEAQSLEEWEQSLARGVWAELQYLEAERETWWLNEGWALHWQGKICQETFGLGQMPALASGPGWENYRWAAEIAQRARERLGEEGYLRLCRQGDDSQILALTARGKPACPPAIQIADTNYRSCGYLYLQHRWTGRPLDLRLLPYTLEHIHYLWRRRVYLETWVERAGHLICRQFCYPE
ncbi:MAG: SpoVR family protein [Clostridia bacterium]|nr:SpoVR family protein [Clostridia bacterium]